MADPLGASFRKPFDEQVAAYKLRMGNLVPTASWDDVWQDAHNTSFMVAGAMKADLLDDLSKAVEKAVTQGTTLEEFRRDFRSIVETRGWHGWTGEGTAKGEAWRTRVIYQTNLRTSYMAGRHAQLVEGGYAFWVYRHGGSMEPRPQHLAWDGLVLAPDHEFWLTHYPPNGWGCSCRVFGARSEQGARRVGGKLGKQLPDGWQARDPRTGAPSGIDRGWGYAPGRTVAARITDVAKAKADLLPQPLQSHARQFAHDQGRSGDAMAEILNRIMAHLDGAFGTESLATAKAWQAPSLSEAQKSVVASYKQSGEFRQQLDDYLRQRTAGAEALDSELDTVARTLDQALSRLPSYKGTVYRDLNLAEIGHQVDLRQLAAGDILNLSGYLSADMQRRPVPLGPVCLIIEGLSGRRVSGPGEGAWIMLRRGLRYEVLESRLVREAEGDLLLLRVRELAPSGPHPVMRGALDAF